MVALHISALWGLIPIFASGIILGYGVGWSKSKTAREYRKVEAFHVLGTAIPYIIGMIVILYGIFEYTPKP